MDRETDGPKGKKPNDENGDLDAGAPKERQGASKRRQKEPASDAEKKREPAGNETDSNVPTEKREPKRPRGRNRKASLKGTNLTPDPRNGNYLWKKVHPITGRRLNWSTKTTNSDIAQVRAAQFQLKLERILAGLAVYEGWKLPIEPLIEQWLNSLHHTHAKTAQALRSQISRAVELLGLKVLADLADPTLDARLRALHESHEFPNITLKRGFQDPLRQFSTWVSSPARGLIDRNPLAGWESIEVPEDEREARGAYTEDEVALTLIATRALDELLCRSVPTSIFFLTVLIGGSRLEVLTERDVQHLLRDERRIDLGVGPDNKPRGHCSLDDKTFNELSDYIGGREAGPIFLSPAGVRLAGTGKETRKAWREAFSLAVVDRLAAKLWDKRLPRNIKTEFLVNRLLLQKRMSYGKHGTTTSLRIADAKEREQFESALRSVADLMRAEWTTRMEGGEGRSATGRSFKAVDVYSLRHTHRTLAVKANVPGTIIDWQQGHTNPARGAAESRTARRHYTDMTRLSGRPSAVAVRSALDRAARALPESSILVKWSKKR